LNLIGTSGAILATLVTVVVARAQMLPSPNEALPIPVAGTALSESDRKAAHDQYEQGKKAFEGGDYLRAATLFLAAYRLAPHHDPLWNAARAYELAGEKVRAANLYTLYLEIAPVEALDRDRATAARRDLAAVLGRLEVHGRATDVRVDDAPANGTTIFVAPGQHIVRGIIDGQAIENVVTVSAGSTLSVALETAPSPGSAPSMPRTSSTAPESPAIARPRAMEARQSSARPLPPLVVYIGAGLTLVAAGFTIASGVDTLNAKSQYEATPSEPLLSDGQSKQDRTNVLFWTTLGLGVTTATLAVLLVHWGRGHEVRAGFGPGSLLVDGRL
jgi:hypothetical protein